MNGYPSKPVYLTPSQKFVYSRNEQKGNISIMEEDSELAWKQGILAFNAVPLTEVFKRMERWYGVTIQEMMNILRIHYNLKFKIENNDIYII